MQKEEDQRPIDEEEESASEGQGSKQPREELQAATPEKRKERDDSAMEDEHGPDGDSLSGEGCYPGYAGEAVHAQDRADSSAGQGARPASKREKGSDITEAEKRRKLEEAKGTKRRGREGE